MRPVSGTSVSPSGSARSIVQRGWSTLLTKGVRLACTPLVNTAAPIGCTSGGRSLTVRVTVVVVEPAELLAVTMYAVGGLSTAGAPVMTPVVLFRVSPAGSAGLTSY